MRVWTEGDNVARRARRRARYAAMPPVRCPACGTEFRRECVLGRPRKYCDAVCAADGQARKKRAAR